MNIDQTNLKDRLTGTSDPVGGSEEAERALVRQMAIRIEERKEYCVKYILKQVYGMTLTKKNSKRISNVTAPADPGHQEFWLDYGKPKQRWILTSRLLVGDDNAGPSLDITSPIKIK